MEFQPANTWGLPVMQPFLCHTPFLLLNWQHSVLNAIKNLYQTIRHQLKNGFWSRHDRAVGGSLNLRPWADASYKAVRHIITFSKKKELNFNTSNYSRSIPIILHVPKREKHKKNLLMHDICTSCEKKWLK
jgi:hypothetical protein